MGTRNWIPLSLALTADGKAKCAAHYFGRNAVSAAITIVSAVWTANLGGALMKIIVNDTS
jgi:hypothetical protein